MDSGSNPRETPQVEMLIYKLAGAVNGAFPKDVELLGAADEL
jgi:hypothetical protein